MAQAKRTAARLTKKQVATRDRELEAKADRGLEPLMKFRWEQTIGTEDGYSFREYAKIIGRSENVVRRAANGYVQLRAAAARMRPLDAMELADQSEASKTAIMAAADAAETTPAEAKRARRPGVKAAKKAAKKAVDEAIAEGKDSEEVEEAAQVAAKAAVAQERSDLSEKRRQAERREVERQRDRSYFNWSKVEGHLLKARRALGDALPLVRDIDWEGEYLEFLEDDLAKTKAMLGLVELALSGSTKTDWDAELGRLTSKEERNA